MRLGARMASDFSAIPNFLNAAHESAAPIAGSDNFCVAYPKSK